jgi:hypothetical protein
MLQKELAQVFLLNSSIQRDAERVTAYEIQVMAHELEIALGGVYSTLSHEYQLPILKMLMRAMQKAKAIPELPEGVTPTIITGMAALGRSADMEKLMQYGAFLGQFPPQMILEYLKIPQILKQGAVSLGLDTEQLLYSEQEVEQKRQQALAAQQQQAAVAPAINAIGKVVSEGQRRQQAEGQTATGAAPPAQ